MPHHSSRCGQHLSMDISKHSDQIEKNPRRAAAKLVREENTIVGSTLFQVTKAGKRTQIDVEYLLEGFFVMLFKEFSEAQKKALEEKKRQTEKKSKVKPPKKVKPYWTPKKLAHEIAQLIEEHKGANIEELIGLSGFS